MMLKLHATFTYTDWQNEISQSLIRLVMFVLQVFNLLFFLPYHSTVRAHSLCSNNGTVRTLHSTHIHIKVHIHYVAIYFNVLQYICAFRATLLIYLFLHLLCPHTHSLLISLACLPNQIPTTARPPIVFNLWKFNCMMSSNYSADYFCKIEICTVIHMGEDGRITPLNDYDRLNGPIS